jgi:hypothetical protein
MTPAKQRPPKTKLLAAIVRQRLADMPVDQFAEGLARLRCSSIADYRKRRLEQLNARERT